MLIESSTGCSREKGWEKGKATLHYQECVYDLLKRRQIHQTSLREPKTRFQKIGLPHISVEKIEHLKHTQKGDISWSCCFTSLSGRVYT